MPRGYRRRIREAGRQAADVEHGNSNHISAMGEMWIVDAMCCVSGDDDKRFERE